VWGEESRVLRTKAETNRPRTDQGGVFGPVQTGTTTVIQVAGVVGFEGDKRLGEKGDRRKECAGFQLDSLEKVAQNGIWKDAAAR